MKGPKLTEFGHALREMRLARSLSQAALARMVEISPGYVGLIETGERGERPSLDIVKRFAQALDCTVEDTERLLKAAGHLGEDETLIPDGRPSFAAFVSSDPRLSKSQKTLLIGMYRSWLGEPPA